MCSEQLSITTMKTILFVLYTCGMIIAAASMGARHADFGTVVSALAAGTLLAMALHDSPRALRPLPRPAMARFPARPTRALDLAA